MSTEPVFHYHNETKHHFERYARSLGYLDWANQPDPFRRFKEADLIPLPFIKQDDTPRYHELYHGAPAPVPVSLESVAQLFELSLAISAWKEFRGNRWALRVNPSSGNLHPTEGYLVIGPREGAQPLPGFGVTPIVCHYAPALHALEIRARASYQAWRALMRAFPAEAFLIGLSSIHWREAWKYGERAFRYCQHDIGHALAALRMAAATLGWRLVLLDDLADGEIAQLLGLDRHDDFAGAEREHPDLLAVVLPTVSEGEIPLSLPAEAIREMAGGLWQGRANRLSDEHVDWPIIEQVAAACEKPRTGPTTMGSRPVAEICAVPETAATARQIIMQRRSAVAFDGRTEISAEKFYRVLARTMPNGAPPWDAIKWPPAIHLCLFVHRITELLPGLYVLVRAPARLTELKAAMRPDFLWQRPPACPEALPLYFLQEGNCQRLAAQVSCWQDIAGDSCFSLGMVADFADTLKSFGPWYYRRLFWETGMIGQVLYLEAEAIGIRSTGIGCFFDNPVHQTFGFADMSFQSLYHFTIGAAVEDTRLTTLPPYSSHLKTERA